MKVKIFSFLIFLNVHNTAYSEVICNSMNMETGATVPLTASPGVFDSKTYSIESGGVRYTANVTNGEKRVVFRIHAPDAKPIAFYGDLPTEELQTTWMEIGTLRNSAENITLSCYDTEYYAPSSN